MLRVVHDTNVAVSALLFRAGRLAWLRDAWAAGTVVPLVCRSTVAELEQVLFYPKFDLDADDMTALSTPPGRTRLSRVTGISLRLPLNRVHRRADCMKE